MKMFKHKAGKVSENMRAVHSDGRRDVSHIQYG